MAVLSAGVAYLDILPNMAGFGQRLTTEVEKSTADATKAAEGQLSNFAQVGQVATAAVVAGFAVVGVAALTAADRFEESHARLETALTNLGTSFDAVKPQVSGLDDKMEKLGFTNSDTENSLARLLPAVKDTGTAIGLMGLAADIARGRHIDLESATQLLVKVETGHIALLGRLGINTKDATGATIDATTAVQRLTEMYGGNAQAYTDTFAGKLAALRAKAEDLAKNIGEALIPIVERMVGIFADGTGWLVKHQAALVAIGVAIGAYVVPAMVAYIALQAQAFADSVVTGAFKLVSAVQTLGTALSGTTNLFAAFAVGAASVAIVAGGVYVLTQRLQDNSKEAKDWAKSFEESAGGISDSSLPKLNAELKTLQDQISGKSLSIGPVNIFGSDADRKAADRAKALASDIKNYEQAKQDAVKKTGQVWADAAQAEGTSADQLTAQAEKLKKAHDDAAASITAAFAGIGAGAEAYGAAVASNTDTSAEDLKKLTTSVTDAKTAYSGLGPAATTALQGLVTDSRLSADQLDNVAKEAQKLRDSMASSFGSATSIVQAFGSQTAVTFGDINKFFKDQVKAAQDWSNNLGALVKAGLDHGLIQQLAEAGPKAAPLVAGLLDDVKRGNLGAINQAQTDLNTILAQTQSSVLGYQTPFFEAGQGLGTGLDQGIGAGASPAAATAKNAAILAALAAKQAQDFFKSAGQEDIAAFQAGIDAGLSPDFVLGLLRQLQAFGKSIGDAFAGGLAGAVREGVVTSFSGIGGAAVSLPAVVHAHNAAGSIVDRPTLSWLGEGYKREVVIPLTDRDRALQLASESGLTSMLSGTSGGSAGSSAPPGGSSTTTVVVPVSIDGQTVATASARYDVAAARTYRRSRQ